MVHLEEWNPIVDELKKNDNVRTFVYNRRGYGFSDSGSAGRTPEEQAKDLKILLRKAGVIRTIYFSWRRVWLS